MKEEYLGLLKSGMFWVFYPQLTGSWTKDKDDWRKIWLKLKKTRNANT